MLKKNFYLEENEAVVGRRIYARGRPNVIGIIVESKRVTESGRQYYGNATSTISHIEVRVFYCRSKRTSQWINPRYRLCDLDAYYRETIESCSQAAMLIQTAEQGEEILRKRNGNQTGR